MVLFASPEWIAELDAVARTVATAAGPPLRVRYRFTADGSAEVVAGYDLVFGDGIRAEPAGPDGGPDGHHRADPDGGPDAEGDTVTVIQPRRIARDVADGRLAAQKALLDGTVAVSGPVTALPAWSTALHALDAALGPLRARTDWS